MKTQTQSSIRTETIPVTKLESKPASVRALADTPVAVLIDHLYGRLVNSAFLGQADRYRSWCLAFDVQQVIDGNLVNMGDTPHPTRHQESEFLAKINEQYAQFRLKSVPPPYDDVSPTIRRTRTTTAHSGTGKATRKRVEAKWKCAPPKVLAATPIAILLDHLCGRICGCAYLGEADRAQSWTIAYHIANAADAVLVRMGDTPRPPTDGERAQYDSQIPEGVPTDYEPFRCVPGNSVTEEWLAAVRKDRTEPGWVHRRLLDEIKQGKAPSLLLLRAG